MLAPLWLRQLSLGVLAVEDLLMMVMMSVPHTAAVGIHWQDSVQVQPHCCSHAGECWYPEVLRNLLHVLHVPRPLCLCVCSRAWQCSLHAPYGVR